MYKLVVPFYGSLLLTGIVAAQENNTDVKIKTTSSMESVTGVFNTPNASVLDFGDFRFSYSDNYFEDNSRHLTLSGHARSNDTKFAFGLLPNFEIIGRLANRDLSCNEFTDADCGTRSLSASAKWQVPFIPKDWFQLALGAQDFGGAARNSETYFAVASKQFSFADWGSVNVNAGVSSTDNNLGYLDGFVGGVEYQFNEYVQLAGEYDANAVNVGVKLFAPKRWLPQGWDVNVSAQLFSSEDETNEHNQWFSADVTIPLNVTGDVKYSKLTLDEPLEEHNHSVKDSSVSPKKLINLHEGNLNQLAAQLVDFGFESIFIKVKNQSLIVRFENNLYNRDERQSLQVVADFVEQQFKGVQATIQMTNFGLLSKSYFVPGEPVRLIHDKAIAKNSTWYDVSNWFAKDNNWVVANEQSAYFVPRLILSPYLNTLVGTEFGYLDYQLTLSSNVQMSLWPGAVVDIRHISDTLAHSDDFDDDEFVYRKYGTEQGIDRRLFHQTVSLPLNVFSKFSYGRIYGNSDGLLNETRWQSTSNKHRLTTLWGDFKDKRRGWGGARTYYKPKLVKYRYRYEKLNWDMEVTAGEYWNGDKGFTLRSLHWFGNTQIGLKYKRTKFDDHNGVDGEEEDFIALGFAIPISFEKSMRPNYGFQVRGIEQWNYSVETLLTTEGNANTIKTNFGREPLLYHNLDQAYFNRDR